MSDGDEWLDALADEQGSEQAATRKAWPQPLDLSVLANTEPVTPPMVIEDWLPAGYATLLAGHGGAGKSAIALHLAVCIASGEPFFGLEVGQRRCLYLSCEDREGVLHWRLSRIADYRGTNIADLHGRLDVLDLVGHDALIYQRNPMTGIDLTAAYSSLAALMHELGTEVVVVDGVADTYGGNENDRGEVKQFVNAIVGLIPPDRGAVLLVSHVNKPTASAGHASEGYSGSTGWHNAVRARWYLRPETEDTDEGREATGDLLLELQKSNLGRTDQALRFRWDDYHHLFIGETEGGMTEFDRRDRDREEQDGILSAMRSVIDAGGYVPAATTGPRTAYHVLSATDTLPESLQNRSARRRFWRHVERLRAIGSIRESSIRRKDRHQTATLEPANTDDRPVASNAGNDDSDIPRTMAAARPAGNAGIATGGTRGSARTQKACPACRGEGDECGWCDGTGRVAT